MTIRSDAFSKEVTGRAGKLVVLSSLPDSPTNYWSEGQIAFSIADGGFFVLSGGGWVQVTETRIVYDDTGTLDRPDVTGSIFWVGALRPTNAISGDLWLNIS